MALVYRQAWGGNDDLYGNIMGQNPAGTYDDVTGQYFGPADLTGDLSQDQGTFISNGSYYVGGGKEGAINALMLVAKHGPEAVARIINSNPAFASLGITVNDVPGIVQAEQQRDANQRSLDAGWRKSTDSGIFGALDNFMNSEAAPLALFGGLMTGVGGFSDLLGSFSGADSPISSFSQSWTQPTQVSSSGGGMDWFDELIGNDFPLGTTYGTDAIPEWMQGNGNWFGEIPDVSFLNPDGTYGTAGGSVPDWMQGSGNWFGSNNVSSLLKNLFGGSGSGVLGGLASNGGSGGLFGSLFGGGVGSVLDKGLAAAPVLAAINYAREQPGFDTSRLTGLYDQFDPSALAFDYDQNTVAGRNALTSSLQNRGVMGSSFATNDITNFNTTRDLGRKSLINQGLGQKANIATSILDAEAKSRALKNQLYGSSLLALGNVFGGRSSPTVNFGGF